MQEQTKACSKCSIIKPFSSFNRCKNKPHGLHSWCRDCSNAYKKQYRASGRQAAAQRSNPITMQIGQMISNSRYRAKQKGLDHNIDTDYLRSIRPTHCPYLGIPLHWEIDRGSNVRTGALPNSPSLDRLDPSKGYIRGNVIIVSHRANSIKNNASEIELIQMGRNIAALKMQLACPD